MAIGPGISATQRLNPAQAVNPVVAIIGGAPGLGPDTKFGAVRLLIAILIGGRS